MENLQKIDENPVFMLAKTLGRTSLSSSFSASILLIASSIALPILAPSGSSRRNLYRAFQGDKQLLQPDNRASLLHDYVQHVSFQSLLSFLKHVIRIPNKQDP